MIWVTLIAVTATRVQFMPDVIDFTAIPDAAGTLGLIFAACGAARGFGPDRLGRITLLGNLVGALLATLVLVIGLMRQVLS